MPFQQTDDPTKETVAARIGAVDEAAWTTGNGTVIAILKAIAGIEGGGPSMTIGGPLDRKADAASVSVALSTEDIVFINAISTVLGATSGSAVITDANGTTQQYLRGLVKLWIAGLTPGEAHIGAVGGHTFPASGTMTRPSDTNVYASGDGVTTATSSASALSVTSAARLAAGSGVIFGGKLTKSTTSTTNASFRGWIYQDSPSATPNDNAAFSPSVHADYQKIVGSFMVDFLASGVVGSDGVSAPITLSRTNMGFKLASGTSLTVILEARAAYIPGSSEIFRLVLDIAQD